MSASDANRLSIHDRVADVLEGRKPDRIPFCDRLELWHTALIRQGRLPSEFKGMSLTEVHRRVGIGQFVFVTPHDFVLRGVEMVTYVDDEEMKRERDPATARFPVFEDLVDTSRPGSTTFELITPVGSVRITQRMLPEAVKWGETCYLAENPIKGPEDDAVIEWIYGHFELVPRFDRIREAETAIGRDGYVVPRLDRIPFQEVLIDLMGEIATFYALADEPTRVHRLMQVMHERRIELSDLLEGLKVPYVEFGDNMTGHMTNPKLFAEYALPQYERYTDVYHRQGKKVGSHTDGELRPLLGLLRKSGLDVCESFSPSPLTECTFDEAWAAWRDGGPIMWGVIPSPLLEERTPEAELHAFVDHVLGTVGDAPVILGISDMVLGNNLIERVEWIARRIEEHVLEPSAPLLSPPPS